MIDRFSVPVGESLHPVLAAGPTYESGKYLHSALSNFLPRKIRFEGITFPSVEHAYQAAKFLDEETRAEIAAIISPGAAKKKARALARNGRRRPDWMQINLTLMGVLTLQKFTIHEDCREVLLMTGGEDLVEGNDWNDTFFGMVWVDGKWRGQNELGKTLMGVREVGLRLSGSSVPSLPV